jgi:hypothetical protein
MINADEWAIAEHHESSMDTTPDAATGDDSAKTETHHSHHILSMVTHVSRAQVRHLPFLSYSMSYYYYLVTHAHAFILRKRHMGYFPCATSGISTISAIV